MNLRPILESERVLIGFCTLVAVFLGVMACGFIQSEHYGAAALFLIMMAVYVVLLCMLWSDGEGDA